MNAERTFYLLRDIILAPCSPLQVFPNKKQTLTFILCSTQTREQLNKHSFPLKEECVLHRRGKDANWVWVLQNMNFWSHSLCLWLCGPLHTVNH